MRRKKNGQNRRQSEKYMLTQSSNASSGSAYGLANAADGRAGDGNAANGVVLLAICGRWNERAGGRAGLAGCCWVREWMKVRVCMCT